MGVLAWFRGVFSSAGPDDEAAEREEFGVAERGETELALKRLVSAVHCTTRALDALLPPDPV